MAFFKGNIRSILIIFLLLIFNIWFAYPQNPFNKSASSQLRIQVIVFSLDEFSDASNFAKEISGVYKLNSYVLQKDGWYKIMLGDFVDFDKANEKLSEVLKSYPKAWIKNSENSNIKISFEYSTGGLNGIDSTITVLPDSVIYITDDSLKSNAQTYGNTFTEIIQSNVLIIIGVLVLIFVSLFSYLRISVIREKKKIKKEQENNQKFWEKLLDDDK